MSFEHKYLKYKQKYLELKEQLKNLQQVGGASNNNSLFDIERLTDTPSNNTKQLGGYLMQSTDSSAHKNSETDTELNLTDLTETPEEHQMVVNLESSDNSEEKTEVNSESEEKSEKDSSSSEEEQEGGNLDTSISELDEIFSQLGGKKSKKDDSDSDSSGSSLTSLSDIEDSSEFDL